MSDLPDLEWLSMKFYIQCDPQKVYLKTHVWNY